MRIRTLRTKYSSFERPSIRPALLICLAVSFVVIYSVSVGPAQTFQIQYKDSAPLYLDFRCPKYVLAGRSPINLYADVFGPIDNTSFNRLRFRWNVTGGRIANGQGQRMVVLDQFKVNPDGLADVKLDLLVEGGPPELPNAGSCSIKVNPTCEVRPTDSYSESSVVEERQQLDRLAEQLKSAPADSTLYIVTYAGKRSCIYETKWRGNRIKRYLIETHHLAGERLIIVEGGSRERWTVELFVQPPGSCGPLPSPTLRHFEAHVQGQCSGTLN